MTDATVTSKSEHTDPTGIIYNGVITVKIPPGWTSAEARTKDGYTIIHLIKPDHKDCFITFWTKTMQSPTVSQATAIGQYIVHTINDLPHHSP